MKNLLLPVLVLLLFTSCDKRIDQCEKTAESFFAAIMEGDEEAMLKAYPLAYHLHYFPHTDSHKINSVKKISDNRYEVNLANTYTKGDNPITKEVSLYLEPINDDSMNIVDSKGLFPKDNVKLYKYAYRHDMIPNGTETDQQLGAVTDSVRSKLISVIMRMQLYTNDYFEISHIKWHKLVDSATGSFLITNKSSYTLDSPKYKLTYYNSRDNIVAVDDGRITYSKFRPGDQVKVDIFTLHVGSANSLKIDLDIDLEETLDNILENN